MKITILTLFPPMFSGVFGESIIKRALEKGLVQINLVNIRDFALDSHKTVDSRPYGGGTGMILRADVLVPAVEAVKTKTAKEKVILLDPGGKLYDQKKAQELAKLNHLILICGHYEGVDNRVRKYINEEVSVGEYVLSGGEIPAMAVVDSLVRLIPGVLKKPEAITEESFQFPISNFQFPVLEYPHFTRPSVFRGLKVPKILLSGDHQKISEWRKKQALQRTKKQRPELLLYPNFNFQD